MASGVRLARFSATITKPERLNELECSREERSRNGMTRVGFMKGVVIAVAAMVLGTLAYIAIGMALASVG